MALDIGKAITDPAGTTKDLTKDPAKVDPTGIIEKGVTTGSEILHGTDPEVTQAETLTPAQEQALKDLLAKLQGQKIDSTTFTKVGVQDISGAGQSSRDQALQQILQSVTGASPETRQKQFQASVADPLTETFEETLEKVGLTTRNPFTSGTERQQTQVAEDFADSLARESANFQLQSQAQDIQARQKAADVLTGLGGQEAGLAQSQLSAGVQAQMANMDAELKAQGLDQRQRESILQGMLELLGVETKETIVDPGTEGLHGELVAPLAGAGGSAIGALIA